MTTNEFEQTPLILAQGTHQVTKTNSVPLNKEKLLHVVLMYVAFLVSAFFFVWLLNIAYIFLAVVFFYSRAKTNTQIANSVNIKRHDLARRKEAKDQNKNVA